MSWKNLVALSLHHAKNNNNFSVRKGVRKLSGEECSTVWNGELLHYIDRRC
ncbi:MAG: hypothetical protein WAZ77_13590 [Candidatus Nitrosopolaris sp.]